MKKITVIALIFILTMTASFANDTFEYPIGNDVVTFQVRNVNGTYHYTNFEYNIETQSKSKTNAKVDAINQMNEIYLEKYGEDMSQLEKNQMKAKINEKINDETVDNLNDLTTKTISFINFVSIAGILIGAIYLGIAFLRHATSKTFIRERGVSIDSIKEALIGLGIAAYLPLILSVLISVGTKLIIMIANMSYFGMAYIQIAILDFLRDFLVGFSGLLILTGIATLAWSFYEIAASSNPTKKEFALGRAKASLLLISVGGGLLIIIVRFVVNAF